jgi:hypothetical protein
MAVEEGEVAPHLPAAVRGLVEGPDMAEATGAFDMPDLLFDGGIKSAPLIPEIGSLLGVEPGIAVGGPA